MLVDGAVHEGRGVISSQVCQEFCNVMLHKLAVPIPTRDLEAYLESNVYPLIRVLPSPRLFAGTLTVSGVFARHANDRGILDRIFRPHRETQEPQKPASDRHHDHARHRAQADHFPMTFRQREIRRLE